MFFNDHAPPHFHALYEESEVLLTIDSLEILHGRLPKRALLMVKEWASQHQDQLMQNWTRARQHEKLEMIEPLK